MSRAQELLATMPPITLFVIGWNVFVYLLQLALEFRVQQYTLSPRAILENHQYYRIVTSTYLHADIIHIAMNLLATVSIGKMVEKRLGSLRYLFTILASTLLTGSIHTLIACLDYTVLGKTGLWIGHSLGFSGVIFHLLVLECSLGSHGNRSIFGFFTVPAYAYPWALMVISQVIIPRLSFVGHLSGILVGTLQIYGFLDCVLPGERFLREMDGYTSLRRLSSWPTYVTTTVLPEASVRSLRQQAMFNGIARALERMLARIRGAVGIRAESDVPVASGGRVLGRLVPSVDEDDDGSLHVEKVSEVV